LRFALALGERRVRVAGIDFYLCLGLCLLTGSPDGHGLVLSNIRAAPVAVLAPPQARRWRPGGAATKEEAVNPTGMLALAAKSSGMLAAQ